MTEDEILKIFYDHFATIAKVHVDVDTVHVEGSVGIATESKPYRGRNRKVFKKFTQIPIKFGIVEGDFKCQMVGLTSLENSPRKVDGDFYVNDNQLRSLVGGPDVVEFNYECHNNFLTDLVGCPKHTPVYLLAAYNNPFTSLNGLPTITHSISMTINPDTPVLKLITLAADVALDLYDHNENPIDDTLRDILHKYQGKVPVRPALIQCQKELIDAGFVDNAKL